MRLKIGRFIILLIFFLVGTFLFFKHPLYSLNEPASIIAIPAKGWITPNTNKLLARNKLVGNFKSPYNNLGIVAVNFTNGGKIVDDQVSFRIKEKGAKKWYYQNLYKTDQFQDRAFFPFGFPEIKNSVGREFTFEIESIKGTERSAIFLNKDNLTFLSKYKLDKSNPVAFFILKLTSSVDFKILLIQLFIALILTYVFSFLSFRKLKFKEIKLSLPAEIGLIVLLSFITILYLYSDNLKASLGLIDDHWIMFFFRT